MDLEKTKKNALKIFLLIVVLALLVLAFFYVQNSVFRKNSKQTISPVTVVENDSSAGAGVAVKSKLDECLGLINDNISNYSGDALYYKIAMIIAQKDENACNSLGENSKYCLTNFYRYRILLDKNQTYFDKIGKMETAGGENSTNFAHGIIEKNNSYCDKIISDNVQMNICKAVASSNVGLCDNFLDSKSYTTNNCIAMDGKDVVKVGCVDVDKGKAVDFCKNSYYTINAFLVNRLDECQKISSDKETLGAIMCNNLLSPNPVSSILDNYKKFAIDECKSLNN